MTEGQPFLDACYGPVGTRYDQLAFTLTMGNR